MYLNFSDGVVDEVTSKLFLSKIQIHNFDVYTSFCSLNSWNGTFQLTLNMYYIMTAARAHRLTYRSAQTL